MSAEEGPLKLPPLDREFLTGIWLGSILYGINLILFCLSIYVLLVKNPKRSGTPLLTITSIFLFLLSTTYVGITFRQLLEAFIYGSPGKATLYFANEPNRLAITKLVLYAVNVFAEELLLIWRMWVIWSYNSKMVILPILFACIQISATMVAVARGSHPGVPIFDPIIKKWSRVNWSFDILINVSVTLVIVYRLWTIGNGVSKIQQSGRTKNGRNKYLGVIWIIIESGLLFALATIVLFSLYIAGSFATPAAIDVVAQLATTAPLLIIVRVAFGITHGESRSTTLNNSTLTNFKAASNHKRPPGMGGSGISSGGGGGPVEISVSHDQFASVGSTDLSMDGTAMGGHFGSRIHHDHDHSEYYPMERSSSFGDKRRDIIVGGGEP